MRLTLPPWGEPDLQGVWTDPFDISLQRTSDLGTRELYAEDEVAALDRRCPGTEVRPRVECGSVADVTGAYDGVFVSLRPTSRFTSLVVDPPDGRLPPITPEVQQRRAAVRAYAMALKQHTDTCREKRGDCADGTYGPPSPRLNEQPPSYSMINLNRADGPEDRNLGERCMGAQLPAFDGFWRIIQSPRVVSIFYDIGQGQGFHRTIPVNDRPHRPSHVREPFGDSRGHWEGQTLVVDVTNFEPYMEFQNSRENLHLVERWTRRDDKTLEYRVTVEDKTTWTGSWTTRQELTRQDSRLNRVYYEPRCHEGNQGMTGLLDGARAAERAFAARRGPHPASLDISSKSESLDTGINDPRAQRFDESRDMRNGLIGALLGALATAVVLLASPGRSAGDGSTAARVPSIGDRPDFSGIWQANNEAHWDVQAHEARAGAVMQPGVYAYEYAQVPAAPSLPFGAAGGVPGSLGVAGDGQIPYTPEALARKRENAAHWLDCDPELKCQLPGVPRAMYMPYPYQIVQSANEIHMFFAFSNAARVIHFDTVEPPPVLQWMGHSVGRWEGDTLVVEVTDLAAEPWFDRAGNFDSDALKVTERYSLRSPDLILYEATVEDPKVFTRRWTIAMPIYRRVEPDMQVLHYRCIPFVEEYLFGHLRRNPLVTRWEGETMTVEVKPKQVPPDTSRERIKGRAQ